MDDELTYFTINKVTTMFNAEKFIDTLKSSDVYPVILVYDVDDAGTTHLFIHEKSKIKPFALLFVLEEWFDNHEECLSFVKTVLEQGYVNVLCTPDVCQFTYSDYGLFCD